jgi:hypothetical protein
MYDLSKYTEEQLRKAQLLLSGSCFSHLAHLCELELIHRKLSPIEEIFPDGGYVTEIDGKEVFVEYKPNNPTVFGGE